MIPDFKDYKYVQRPVEYFERKKEKTDARKLVDALRNYRRPLLRAVPSDLKRQAQVTPVHGQSPVNIDEGHCIWQWYPPLEFQNMNNPIRSSRIQNTGSTCQISVEGGRIKGGPLFGEYSFLEMHFHWARGQLDGTEHAINGHKYICEAQFVFQANQCLNCQLPAQRPPLCVISALFRVSDYEPKHNYSNYLERIVEPNTSVVANENLLLDFGKYLQPSGYYTYSGSLTTSPYTENVQWIVYKQIFAINRLEINGLRALGNTNGGQIEENVRELQDIGERIINATTE